jgi:hypothetical protein
MKLTRTRAGIGPIAAPTALAVLLSSCGGSPQVSPPPTTLPAATTTTTLAPSNNLCSRLPAGDPYADCGVAASRLLPQVESAMDTLIAERPQLFDLRGEHSPGGRAFKSSTTRTTRNGLVATLLAVGLCAGRHRSARPDLEEGRRRLLHGAGEWLRERGDPVPAPGLPERTLHRVRGDRGLLPGGRRRVLGPDAGSPTH